MNSGDTSAAAWCRIDDALAWDAALAALGGHPLQSCLWGDARKEADGIDYLCLGVKGGDGLTALARIETRRLPLLGRLAWLPRGPVCEDAVAAAALPAALRELGYLLYAASPWQRIDPGTATAASPRTLWLDLQLGKEALLARLDSQWRYGARRALREGVTIATTTNDNDVAWFYGLCAGISQTKGFVLPGSLALMQALLRRSQPHAPVQAALFVARHDTQPAAGAFVLRAGRHVHYLWGGVDRAHARLRAGEAVQWAVIEWALAQQATLYDLEGIDPVNNPGTYEFKKKMGGDEIVLAAPVQQPLDWRGTLVAQALRWRAGRSG